MRVLTLSSLLVCLGAGVALAATDEGVNPFRLNSTFDAEPGATPNLLPQRELIDL